MFLDCTFFSWTSEVGSYAGREVKAQELRWRPLLLLFTYYKVL